MKRFLASLRGASCLTALLLSACPLSAEEQAQPPAEQAQDQQAPAEMVLPEAPSNEDISYALGFTMAADMSQRDMGIDKDQLMQGMAAGFAGQEPRLTQEQLAMCMITFQMRMQQEQQKMMQEHMQMAQANLEEGQAFLKDHAEKEGVTITDSGLQYKVITPGDGQSPEMGQMVTVHYTGKLIDGTVFDSSEGQEPRSFQVGGVIPGWNEALQMMKVGGKWELAVPADLAYGEQGRSTIPPNATLIFTVELLGIE